MLYFTCICILELRIYQTLSLSSITYILHIRGLYLYTTKKILYTYTKPYIEGLQYIVDPPYEISIFTPRQLNGIQGPAFEDFLIYYSRNMNHSLILQSS